jgi:small subunit ribosomal protein S5
MLMDKKEIIEKVIENKKVVKKVTGGNTQTFTSFVIVGDKEGKVGYALGKSRQSYPQATQRAVAKARKSMVALNLVNGTIAHPVSAKYKSSKILVMPAPEGAGIIAGGVVRDIMNIVGIKNISVKQLGSSNKFTNVMCTIKALETIK